MQLTTIANLLSACHLARKITDLLPPLPPQMTPRHIFILEVIHNLSITQKTVKISDISEHMQVTRPSVTKMINELVQMDCLMKTTAAHDKRITWIKLTPLGEKYYDFYVSKFHNWLNSRLTDCSEADAQSAISMLHKLYNVLNDEKRKKTLTAEAEVLIKGAESYDC